ncbi:hypothetical protein [Microvirga sp. G4-2]|uniref:hypothetical protein n=1 Tax=Microvirga sp. G4-2 TaxID=3434467 RepID=UPI004043D455
MAHLKQNNYKERNRNDCTGSPGIDAMMREVLHRLGDIDVEYEIRLDEVEHSCTDQELKSHIKKKITAAHYERREPYVELLTTLRQRQQRLSLAQ